MADQPLKEHMVFFVIAACAATAGATWVVSENVRVKPLSMEMDRINVRYKALQEKENARMVAAPSAPTVSDVLLAKVKNETAFDVEQSFFFRDPEGDAAFLSFVVLGSNANHLNVRSVNIDVPVDQQIKGGVVTKTWRCVNNGYFVRLRAYITDAAGNVSRPRDYTINC